MRLFRIPFRGRIYELFFSHYKVVPLLGNDEMDYGNWDEPEYDQEFDDDSEDDFGSYVYG